MDNRTASSMCNSSIVISTGIGVGDMFVIVESYKRLTPRLLELGSAVGRKDSRTCLYCN